MAGVRTRPLPLLAALLFSVTTAWAQAIKLWIPLTAGQPRRSPQLSTLDRHCLSFIAHAPFVLIATSDGAGPMTFRQVEGISAGSRGNSSRRHYQADDGAAPLT